MARLLLLSLAPCCAVFSPLDEEIAEHHAAIEELWRRLGVVADELQAAGKMPGSGSDAELSSETLQRLLQVQETFLALQRQAYDIGAESPDNAALAKHPKVRSRALWSSKTLRIFKTFARWRLTSSV